MDKTDYHGKMDALVNDKKTYEELKRDPTPALQRTTATETLRSLTYAKTTQTWFLDSTYCFFLWFSHIPTVQVPYDEYRSLRKRVTSQTVTSQTSFVTSQTK